MYYEYLKHKGIRGLEPIEGKPLLFLLRDPFGAVGSNDRSGKDVYIFVSASNPQSIVDAKRGHEYRVCFYSIPPTYQQHIEDNMNSVYWVWIIGTAEDLRSSAWVLPMKNSYMRKTDRLPARNYIADAPDAVNVARQASSETRQAYSVLRSHYLSKSVLSVAYENYRLIPPYF